MAAHTQSKDICVHTHISLHKLVCGWGCILTGWIFGRCEWQFWSTCSELRGKESKRETYAFHCPVVHCSCISYTHLSIDHICNHKHIYLYEYTHAKRASDSVLCSSPFLPSYSILLIFFPTTQLSSSVSLLVFSELQHTHTRTHTHSFMQHESLSLKPSQQSSQKTTAASYTHMPHTQLNR